MAGPSSHRGWEFLSVGVWDHTSLAIYWSNIKSPIHFVKLRLTSILGTEFLVQMFKRLQNYTSEMYIITKIMYIWGKLTIFCGEKYTVNINAFLTGLNSFITYGDRWFRSPIHGFYFQCLFIQKSKCLKMLFHQT